MSISFFLQSKKKKVFDENIPGFSPYNGLQNQTVQGPNESFSAASNGFKRHKTMNKGLIIRLSFKATVSSRFFLNKFNLSRFTD